MTRADEPQRLPGAGSAALALAKRIAASPRLYVYAACTVGVVLTSYFLGKELLWDTQYYHVYAGFSALHDRFGQDYFAAGPQGYFNPYAYVPFYLLIRSSLTPLADASILAVLQSAILWLTYELTLSLAPEDKPKARVAMGALAAVFAFANPILVNQFGSSYVDVTTAEVALAGWLVLVGAVRNPSVLRVIGGALLLGAASALKPTNAAHAVAATTLVLFIPGTWRRKFRDVGVFALCVAAGFVLVNLPWSIHLVRHFGNPVFPLLNGVFRSPEYSTGTMLDYRFLPVSLAAALLRPFTMALPVPMVQYELSAPDLRYAVLLVLAAALFARSAWRRASKPQAPLPSPAQAAPSRALTALGCAFLVDWVLWLTASGNGRYFIPPACVAGALCVVLLFQLLAGRPRVRNYAFAALFGAQLLGLYAGSGYRVYLPWTPGPWYSVSVPADLRSQANLYFMVGAQTNSFIIPDMPAGSGFVNLGGNFMLMRSGPNGAHIEALIRKFAPHWRMIERDPRGDARQEHDLPDPALVDDTLQPFALQVRDDDCSHIVVRGVPILFTVTIAGRGTHQRSASAAHTDYLVTCPVVRARTVQGGPLPGQREADLAFDHLEEACPALFQPRRPGDRILGGPHSGHYFARNYSGSGVVAWITHGSVEFQKLIGGREENVGSERLWQKGVPRVACGWSGTGFLHVLGAPP